MGYIAYWLNDKFEEWLEGIVEKFKDNPLWFIFNLTLLIFIIPILGKIIYDVSRYSTLFFYLACIYKINALIDNPKRAVLWCVGYFGCAIIVQVALESIFPLMRNGDLISAIVALIISLLLLQVYLQFYDKKSA